MELKRRAIGGIGTDVARVVPPSLAEGFESYFVAIFELNSRNSGANLLNKAIKDFGDTAETLISTHRRGIVG